VKLEVKKDAQTAIPQPGHHLGTRRREQLQPHLDPSEARNRRYQGKRLGGIAAIEGQDQEIGGVGLDGGNRGLGQNTPKGDDSSTVKGLPIATGQP